VVLDIAIFVALLASVASLASLASPPVAVDNAFDLVVAFLGVYRFDVSTDLVQGVTSLLVVASNVVGAVATSDCWILLAGAIFLVSTDCWILLAGIRLVAYYAGTLTSRLLASNAPYLETLNLVQIAGPQYWVK